MLARLWAGEAVAPARKERAPLFRDFAARYHERRKGRWKPSSLTTFDIYLKNRLMPHFDGAAGYHRPCAALGMVRRRERQEARYG